MRLSLAAAAALFTTVSLAGLGRAAYRSHVLATDHVLVARDVLSVPYQSSSPAVLVYRQQKQQQQPPAPPGMSAAGIAAEASETVRLNPNGSLNVTAWDMETNAACIAALRSLTRSTNPSGNCICYNLPSLDTGSGVFEADLRLYRISPPRDDFASVSPSSVNVAVSFIGASVSPVQADELMGMGMVSNMTKVIQQRALEREPQLIHTYLFVGQIDQGIMRQNMSMAALQSSVMPTFTLTANTPNGGAVSTNVSLNEASFLTGVFSQQVVLSDFSAAKLAVDDQIEALHNGTHAFVLPGTQLMIFPIGLVITSVWLAIGFVAYGIGTFERVGYAEAHKRRQRTAGRSVMTI